MRPSVKSLSFKLILFFLCLFVEEKQLKALTVARPFCELRVRFWITRVLPSLCVADASEKLWSWKGCGAWILQTARLINSCWVWNVTESREWVSDGGKHWRIHTNKSSVRRKDSEPWKHRLHSHVLVFVIRNLWLKLQSQVRVTTSSEFTDSQLVSIQFLADVKKTEQTHRNAWKQTNKLNVKLTDRFLYIHLHGRIFGVNYFKPVQGSLTDKAFEEAALRKLKIKKQIWPLSKHLESSAHIY